MTTEQLHGETFRVQYLSDQQAQLSVTEHGNSCTPWNGRLIQNLTRCCERLDEYGDLGRNRRWNHMEIHFRQGQKLTERAIMPNDSKHLAIGTGASETTSAPITFPASQIDFTDHTSSQ